MFWGVCDGLGVFAVSVPESRDAEDVVVSACGRK